MLHDYGYIKNEGYKISLTSVYSSLHTLVKADLVLRTMSSNKKIGVSNKNKTAFDRWLLSVVEVSGEVKLNANSFF